MNPSQETLAQKLVELEMLVGVAEYKIASELRKLKNLDNEEDSCQEWIYELLAFSFNENASKENSWSTYFDTMIVSQTDDGQTRESPSIQLVDEKVINYWNTRYQVTNNSLMKARYSGLVWYLSEKTTGNKPNYSVAVTYCQALLQIAKNNNHKYEVDIIRKLQRALSIATSLNQSELIEDAKQTILTYENLVGEDVALYFRVVLTDQRGLNIRNNLCHGIPQKDVFSKPVTQRLIHMLLVLAQLRIQNNP